MYCWNPNIPWHCTLESLRHTSGSRPSWKKCIPPTGAKLCDDNLDLGLSIVSHDSQSRRGYIGRWQIWMELAEEDMQPDRYYPMLWAHTTWMVGICALLEHCHILGMPHPYQIICTNTWGHKMNGPASTSKHHSQPPRAAWLAGIWLNLKWSITPRCFQCTHHGHQVSLCHWSAVTFWPCP